MSLAIASLVATVVVALIAGVWLIRSRNMHYWLADYLRTSSARAQRARSSPRRVFVCIADHHEPLGGTTDLAAALHRARRWCEGYVRSAAGHVDSDGRPPQHTYFYPAEEYAPEVVDQIADLCRRGLGEIEVHLHHDNDDADNLRRTLARFTDILHERHGALRRDESTGRLLYCFVHGNWALDNSRPDGNRCGVNDELVILREEGCYADFTLPSAPDVTQTATVNRIYYATDDPDRPKSHDRGERVRVGGGTGGDLMIVQGPLRLNWRRRKFGVMPRIENSDVKASNPPTPDRVDLWVETGIHVEGRPEWVFVKVHTHGTQTHDIDALLGAPVAAMFDHLETRYNDGTNYRLHYVSAREMYNIVKAAEAGCQGDPGQYRDFVVPRPGYTHG